MSKKKKNRPNPQNSGAAQSGTSASAKTVSESAAAQKQPREIRHLNTRFLSGLLIVCAVSALGLYFLHDFQVKRSADQLLTRSDQALAEGDSEKAMELLGQYLKFEPEDTDSLAKLGDLVDGSPPAANTWMRAYRIYSRVLRDAPEIESAAWYRYRLVQLMMQLDEFQQAEFQIGKLHEEEELDVKDSGLPFTRSELFLQEGFCKQRQSRRDQAMPYFLAAIAADESKLEPYLQAINSASALGNDLPTRNRIESALAKLPGKVKYSTQLADYLAHFPQVVRAPEQVNADETPKPDGYVSGDTTDASKDDTETQASPGAEPAGTESASTVASTEELIELLLDRMVERVEPKFEAYLVRANHRILAKHRMLSEKLDSAVVEENVKKIDKTINDDIQAAETLAGNDPKFRLFQAGYELLMADYQRSQAADSKAASPMSHIQKAIEIAATEQAAALARTGSLDENLQTADPKSGSSTQDDVSTGKSDAVTQIGLEEQAEAFLNYINFSVRFCDAQMKRFEFETEEEAKRDALLQAERALDEAIRIRPAARAKIMEATEQKVAQESQSEREAVQQRVARRAQRDLDLKRLNPLELDLPVRLIDTKLTAMGSRLLDEEQFDSHSKQVTSKIAELASYPNLNVQMAIRPLLQYLEAHWGFVHLSADGKIPERDDLTNLKGSEASWRTVTDLLEKSRVEQSRDQRARRKIDLMLSDCYRALQAPEERERLFRDIVTSTDRNWPLARLEYARLLEELGKLDEAFLNYGLSGSEAGGAAQIRILIRRQLELPADRRKWQDIQRALDQRISQNSRNVQYQLLQVELHFVQQRYGDVEKLLDELRNRNDVTPADLLAVWRTAIQYYLNRDDVVRANTALQRALEALGPKPELILSELSIASETSKAEFKLKLDQLRNSLEQNSDTEQSQYSETEQLMLLTALAQGYEELKEDESRTGILKQLAKRKPDQLSYRWFLSGNAIRSGADSELEEQLKAIRRIDGEQSAIAKYLEASRLLERIRKAASTSESTSTEEPLALYSQAMALLEQAERVRPDWVQIYLLRGDLAGLSLIGDELAQFEAYSKAIELGTDNQLVYERVMAYLSKHDRESEAILLGERVRREKPEVFTSKIASQLSSVLFEEQNYREAFALRRQSLARLEEKYERHLNEAFLQILELQVLELRNPASPEIPVKLKSIEAELESAVKEGPGSDRVWIGYVLFHKDRNKLDEAKKVIQRAEQSLPENTATTHLALGACYELIGDHDAAREQYDRALSIQPDSPAVHSRLADFFRRIEDSAQEDHHLKQYQELVGKDSVAGRNAQYRREALKAQDRSYRTAERAIAELEKTIPPEKELRLRNLATQTGILTRFSVRPFQLKLIKVLEEMKSMDALPLTDQITLLAVYRQTNQLDRAEQEAKLLRQKYPNDQLILTLYTELCLQQKNYEEAEKLLPLLEQSLPETGLVVTLKAQKAFDQGQKQDAVQQVLDYHKSLKPTLPAEQIFREAVSRSNYHVAFRWLYEVPGIQGSIEARRVAEGLSLLNRRKLDAALNVLKPVLELEQVQKAAFAQRLRECFVLLSRFDQLADAERICREYLEVSGKPEDVVLLISLIGQQGDVQRTLDLCEASLETAGATRVIPNAIALLRQHNHTDADEARVEHMISRSLASNPNDLSALLQSADYQDYKQNYDAAEKTYALILSKNGDSPLALNNLAWLFAMHNPTPDRIDKARQLIDRAIDRVGPSAELQDTKATVELAAGKAREAITLLEQSIKTSTNAVKIFHLAQAQLELGLKAEAKESLIQANDQGLDIDKLHPLEAKSLERLRNSLTARL